MLVVLVKSCWNDQVCGMVCSVWNWRRDSHPWALFPLRPEHLLLFYHWAQKRQSCASRTWDLASHVIMWLETVEIRPCLFGSPLPINLQFQLFLCLTVYIFAWSKEGETGQPIVVGEILCFVLCFVINERREFLEQNATYTFKHKNKGQFDEKTASKHFLSNYTRFKTRT